MAPKNITVPAPIARRINDLLRRRAVRELSRAATELHLPAWIVGGAVRDLWLDRPVHDVDAAVDGDALPIARLLESRGVGKLVPLSLDPPRVFRLAGRGTEIDLAELWGASIEKDLARRDFTANAIALPLQLPGGGPVDPFGGVGDLRARRLRALQAENFLDDPLRSLRAARFIATHGLVPDRKTEGICRAAASGLAGVAPERIRDELDHLLGARRAGPALACAARIRVLGPALGVVSSQSLRALLSRGAFDAPAILRLEPAARVCARLALLGLALGLTPARISGWLAARRWSREDAGRAGTLAKLVVAALTLADSRDAWRWIRDAAGLAPSALALLEAQGPAGRRLARLLRRRVAAARARPVPRVKGGDLLVWLGIPAGPAVGQLLRELEIACLSGRVRTRGQARKWLVANAPAIIRSS